MRAAVLGIEIGERDAAPTARPGNLHLGAEHHQGGCEIAAEGRMAALALGRDMAGVAAMLEAILVRAPPPFALIVIDAAGIEAEIAAYRRHAAVAGTGDRFGGLGRAAIAFADTGVGGKT